MNLEQKNAYFNSFIEEYKDKTLPEKQKLIINDLKELIGMAQKICIDKGIKYDLLFNREIADINKDNYTEDDFAEAVYTYIQMFKEIFSSYILPDYNDNN